MRFKKTIIFSIIVLVIFLIWTFFHGTKVNYVALGDSVAIGVNPYGEIGYSYADYFKDYLDSNKKLGTYVKNFAVSGYTTSNVISDINVNKEINVDGRNINIRQALREADIVTISIGANDFMKGINISNFNLDDVTYYKGKIDNIMFDIDEVLELVRKYAKEEVILIGYYNPFPILFDNYEKQLDEIFSYQDKKFLDVCKKNDVEYISVYQLFKDNSKFLPNPFDIHPNLEGHKSISELLIDKYEKNNM